MTDVCVGKHVQEVTALYSRTQGFTKQETPGYPIQENTKPKHEIILAYTVYWAWYQIGEHGVYELFRYMFHFIFPLKFLIQNTGL
jgi:hypothetical protein